MSISPYQRGRGGFTVIELLVVVAVIAVLLALTLPSVARARMAARQLECASQLRAFGQIFALYGHDNKHWLPTRDDGGGSGAGGSGYPYPNVPRGFFHRKIQAYVAGGGTAQIGTSASYRVHKLFFDPEGTIEPRLRAAYLGIDDGSLEYGYYGHCTTGTGIMPRSPKRTTDAFDQSNRRSVLIGCNNRFRNRTTLSPIIGSAHNDPAYPTETLVSGALTGLVYTNGRPRGVNVAYVDGAVSWIVFDDLNRDSTYYATGPGSGVNYSFYWKRD